MIFPKAYLGWSRGEAIFQPVLSIHYQEIEFHSSLVASGLRDLLH